MVFRSALFTRLTAAAGVLAAALLAVLLSVTAGSTADERVYVWRDQDGAVRFSAVESLAASQQRTHPDRR